MIEKISNPTVKAAMEAWQIGSKAEWLSFSTADAKAFDNGNGFFDLGRFVRLRDPFE